MYNTFSLTLTHTRDRSSEDCIHTYLGTRCARTRCNATTNAKIKKETKKKTISTSASPLSSIRRRSTKKKKKRNNSKWKWRNRDVIPDVDGIEDEIIKAFHLSLQSKDENHSESINSRNSEGE